MVDGEKTDLPNKDGGCDRALTSEDKETLRSVARGSIATGLREGHPLQVDLEAYRPRLRDAGSTFVTLELDDRLRGCIGSLEDRRPLVEDVAENAYAAAFRDPRFLPVSPKEFDSLEMHISLLSPLSPLEVESEDELLVLLRPGVDGLLLDDSPFRSTFLPQVWKSLAEPKEFVTQLKLKAGLSADHWSPSIRFFQYTVEEF
jgi:AmmeMemoRadiSam system protein A